MAVKGDTFESGWADRWTGEPRGFRGYTGSSSLLAHSPGHMLLGGLGPARRVRAQARSLCGCPVCQTSAGSLLASVPRAGWVGGQSTEAASRKDPRCWWPGQVAAAGTREVGRLGRTEVNTGFRGGVRHGGAQPQPQYGQGAVHALGLVPRFGGETRCLGIPCGQVAAGLQGLVLRREAGAREGVGRRP